jgi:predicted oxidoreductase
MRKIQTREKELSIPAVGLGCMRIPGLREEKKIRHLIDTAMENGVCFFDHADIYGGGESESLFGNCVTPSLREKMLIQTKCGIRKGQFDFSKAHILSSVEGSLKRLNMDYVDILLLHRPDTLMEPEEVAEAFEELVSSGKVRYFGVSNMNPWQIELLNEATKGRILFDQVQFSIAHAGLIDSGLNVNMYNEESVNRDGGLLEYSRLRKVTLQAWSPFQYGMFQGVFIGNEKFPELNKKMEELAEKYHVSVNAVAVAWIMRHPAKIQTIVGTTNAERLKGILECDTFTLTREEWYALYLAAGKKLP